MRRVREVGKTREFLLSLHLPYRPHPSNPKGLTTVFSRWARKTTLFAVLVP
jgi:hypothetical protein